MLAMRQSDCKSVFVYLINGGFMAKKLMSALMMLGTLGVLLSVTACNTVAGAGKDVERAGDAIHDKARDVQNDK